MKIIEVSPIYNEIGFVNYRLKKIKSSNFDYSFMPAILDCKHNGQKRDFDIKKSIKERFNKSEIKILEQSGIEAKLIFEKNWSYFESQGFNIDFTYDMGQRAVFYKQLFNLFNKNSYPDILILSDVDELLSNIEITKIIEAKEQIFRCAMDWLYCDPIFKYNILWPGSLVIKGKSRIKNFLNDPHSVAKYHKSRQLDMCKVTGGTHMSYLGSPKDLIKKCKRMAERNAKRVFVARTVGPILLKLGIDPMVRKGFKIQRIVSNRFVEFHDPRWLSWKWVILQTLFK